MDIQEFPDKQIALESLRADYDNVRDDDVQFATDTGVFCHIDDLIPCEGCDEMFTSVHALNSAGFCGQCDLKHANIRNQRWADRVAYQKRVL